MTNRKQLGIGLAVVIVLLLIGTFAYDGGTRTPSAVNTQNGTDANVATTTDTSGDASSAAGGTMLTASERCSEQGGTWSAEYNECTGVGEASCKAMSGTWNDCASPCRNDPNADVCIQMCVQVCTL